MPIVTAYPIDLTNDPQPSVIGLGGEFDGPYKAANGKLYVWGFVIVPPSGGVTVWVYKSTDGGRTWAAQDTSNALAPVGSPGPTAISTDGNRLTVGQLEHVNFGNFLSDFDFTTDRWLVGEGVGAGGHGYGILPDSPFSSSHNGDVAGSEMRYLSNGNIRYIYGRHSDHHSSLSSFRMYYAEYSFGSSSWITTDVLISNENTFNVQSSPTCSAIDGSDNIAVVHINTDTGDAYYNSIDAGGSVSASVDLTATITGINPFGQFWNCISDGAAIKIFTAFGATYAIPTILRGSSFVSPVWTSYSADADVGDDMRAAYMWKDSDGKLRETWSDRGDHGSLATGHHFAEVLDGNPADTYYDIAGFISSQYVIQFSVSKDGYLVYMHNGGHLYFIPPIAPKRRNYSYVGRLTTTSVGNAGSAGFSY